MLFKETRYQVKQLISDIELGRLALPELQRPFVWKKSKVRDLFDSMYRGFPVGYILLWNTAAEVASKPVGESDKQDAPTRFIVDGQQRLTSLYSVFTGTEVTNGKFAKERIRIAFQPQDGRFEVADAATERAPEFLPDISALWVDSEWQVGNRFIERLKAAREVSHDEEDRLRQAISRLHNLDTYMFVANEIEGSANDEQVAEIFLRINSGGTQLVQSDFILTLMSVFREEDRRRLEEFAKAAKSPSGSAPSPFNHLIKPEPEQLLRVAVLTAFQRGRLESVTALLRSGVLNGGDRPTAERRQERFDELGEAITEALDLTTWHEFLKALPVAGFYRAKEISSANNAVFSYALYLLGRRRFGLGHGALRVPIARYFFMSALTGRYTGSFEARITQDVQSFCAEGGGDAYLARLDEVVATTLTDDYWRITLPQALNTSAARGPALFAYSGALCILDARLPFTSTGQPIQLRAVLAPGVNAPKDAVERHHLFPKAYLEKLGVTSPSRVNQIANMGFVEWPDNIEISDRSPAEYWPHYSGGFTEADLRNHALWEGWPECEYGEFLAQRRSLMAAVIAEGFRAIGA
jgi:hypothetical protein